MPIRTIITVHSSSSKVGQALQPGDLNNSNRHLSNRMPSTTVLGLDREMLEEGHQRPTLQLQDLSIITNSIITSLFHHLHLSSSSSSLSSKVLIR